MELHTITQRHELLGAVFTEGVGLIAPELFAAHAPQCHLFVSGDDHRVMARCSVWVDSVRRTGSRCTGVIGHFAALDAAMGTAVLREAVGYLKGRGCDYVVGPMDGNTWRSYRLVTVQGQEPPFFLEPNTPEAYVQAFGETEFEALAEYYSTVTMDLTRTDERFAEVERRLVDNGVNIRPISMEQFECDAEKVFELSLLAFANNFLYTPITKAEFMASYQKIKPYVRPEFCLLAEQSGQVVGFIFGIPDMLQTQRGQAIDTIIVKTLAVRPGRIFAGLGGLLVERVQQAAQKAGFKRSIHALMHASNKSRNISAGGHPIRRYTLFGRSV